MIYEIQTDQVSESTAVIISTAYDTTIILHSIPYQMLSPIANEAQWQYRALLSNAYSVFQSRDIVPP